MRREYIFFLIFIFSDKIIVFWMFVHFIEWFQHFFFELSKEGEQFKKKKVWIIKMEVLIFFYNQHFLHFFPDRIVWDTSLCNRNDTWKSLKLMACLKLTSNCMTFCPVFLTCHKNGRSKMTVPNSDFELSKIKVKNRNFGRSKIRLHNRTFGWFKITAINCSFGHLN